MKDPPNNETNSKVRFSSAITDVSLFCKYGTVIHTHSVVLKTTSGFFRTLSTLPQPSSNEDSPATLGDSSGFTLHLEDDPEVLEILIRMISGVEIPTFDSFESLEDLLYMAEKYEMPGPISIIRSLILTPKFLEHPLRIYVLACRYDWQDVAKVASTLTLKANLQELSTEANMLLHTLSSESLMRLLELHWARMKIFKEKLESPNMFARGNNRKLFSRCEHGVDADASWPKLKLAMLRELERCPAADGIIGPGFVEWPEWKAVVQATCWECRLDPFGPLTLYDASATLNNIRGLVSLLPGSI